MLYKSRIYECVENIRAIKQLKLENITLTQWISDELRSSDSLSSYLLYQVSRHIRVNCILVNFIDPRVLGPLCFKPFTRLFAGRVSSELCQCVNRIFNGAWFRMELSVPQKTNVRTPILFIIFSRRASTFTLVPFTFKISFKRLEHFFFKP